MRKLNKHKKTKYSAGFTLSEMLTSLIILALAMAIIAGGMPVLQSVKKSVTERNETNMLASIVITKVTDEFRYATGYSKTPEEGMAQGESYKSRFRSGFSRMVNNVNDSILDELNTRKSNLHSGVYIKYQGGIVPLLTRKTFPDGVYITITSPDGTGSYYYDMDSGLYCAGINFFHDGEAEPFMSKSVYVRPLISEKTTN